MLHNRANVAVSAERSPGGTLASTYKRFNSVSIGCTSESYPCGRAVSEFGKNESGKKTLW